MPWLNVKWNYFEVISQLTVSETEIKLSQPLKESWNYFKTVSATLNTLQHIHYKRQSAYETNMKHFHFTSSNHGFTCVRTDECVQYLAAITWPDLDLMTHILDLYLGAACVPKIQFVDLGIQGLEPGQERKTQTDRQTDATRRITTAHSVVLIIINNNN